MMIKISKYLTLFVLMISFACGSEKPEPIKTPEQLAIESLAGSSSLRFYVGPTGNVSKNGNSETHLYQDFEILFANNKTYSTSNANFAFEGSGTWNFVGEDYSKIILGGVKPASNQPISFTRSDRELTLIFSIDPPANGKVQAVVGSYQMRLNLK